MSTPSEIRGVLFGLAAILAGACSPNPPRDVVPETHDVRSTTPAPTAATGGYLHVARRAHGTVALAGVRNLGEPEARRVVDAAADELERCAVLQEQRGLLVEGAARLVVAGDARGNTQVGEMQLAPGGAVAANALTCLVMPLRAMPFPVPAREVVPALLLEATWAPSPHDGGADTGLPSKSSG